MRRITGWRMGPQLRPTAQQIPEARPSAVLFDSDGVLVDSRRVVERHWRRWATQHQIDIAEVLRLAHGRRTTDVIQQLAPHLDAEKCAAVLDDAEGHDAQDLSAFPVACSMLEGLSELCWGVVTSGDRALALRRLNFVGLPAPPVLVTGDEVSHGKPAPDCYLLGARRLGLCPHACIAIEDAPAGVEAAASAGMTTIAVTTTHDAGKLDRADLIVPSLREVEQALRAWLPARCWQRDKRPGSVPPAG